MAKKNEMIDLPVIQQPEVQSQADNAQESPAPAPSPELPQDGSHLYHAARLAGATSMQELQKIQAEQRALQYSGEQPVVAADPLDDLDLEALVAEVRQAEQDKVELEGKMAKAQKKLNEISAHVDKLRAKVLKAQQKSDALNNVEYLEAQKRERIERYKTASRARKALEDAGVQHTTNLDVLGLGKSPLDRAVAAELQQKRKQANAEALRGR